MIDNTPFLVLLYFLNETLGNHKKYSKFASIFAYKNMFRGTLLILSYIIHMNEVQLNCN